MGINSARLAGCFQWFKDTKMKANHNYLLVYRSSS